MSGWVFLLFFTTNTGGITNLHEVGFYKSEDSCRKDVALFMGEQKKAEDFFKSRGRNLPESEYAYCIKTEKQR